MSEAPFLVDDAGRRFPLSDTITTLGRASDCDIFIPDRRTSRHHAEIHWDGTSCTLWDTESANGTYLNGERIHSPRVLRDGDTITVGGATFTFHDPAATLRVAEFPLLVVDEGSGGIWVDRTPVLLSPKERALFDLLYHNAGRPCSKQEIAHAVWPEYRAEVYDYQIESLVKRLREKLEPDPRHPTLILTERGRGYRLVR